MSVSAQRRTALQPTPWCYDDRPFPRSDPPRFLPFCFRFFFAGSPVRPLPSALPMASTVSVGPIVVTPGASRPNSATPSVGLSTSSLGSENKLNGRSQRLFAYRRNRRVDPSCPRQSPRQIRRPPAGCPPPLRPAAPSGLVRPLWSCSSGRPVICRVRPLGPPRVPEPPRGN